MRILFDQDAFDTLITTDKNLRYQQNLVGKRLAIVVLPTTSWPEIQKYLDLVSDAVKAIRPGDYVQLSFYTRT